jgi:hypothetical protein
MKQLRFVSAQPATKYYAWQVEVMINNFIEMGINANHIDVIAWKENGIIPEEWSKLANRYAARFFFYDDTRDTKYYVSSIRPNILKQHFKAHSYLKYDVIFYHDCDIIFTKNPREWITDEMLSDDIWYGSDTRWYISHSYIKSKGDDVMKKMCDIMQIDEQIVEENELNCIGAQYLMKNIDYSFWDMVEKDSEKLFKDVTNLNTQKIMLDKMRFEEEKKEWEKNNPEALAKGEKYSRPLYHELQIWCADMWAVLWGAWRLGYKTNCHPNYEFSWATSNEEEYQRMNIMHNAGVASANEGLFYKASYMNEYPYNKNLTIREGTSSKKYYEWVQKTEKITALQ